MSTKLWVATTCLRIGRPNMSDPSPSAAISRAILNVVELLNSELDCVLKLGILLLFIPPRLAVGEGGFSRPLVTPGLGTFGTGAVTATTLPSSSLNRASSCGVPLIGEGFMPVIVLPSLSPSPPMARVGSCGGLADGIWAGFVTANKFFLLDCDFLRKSAIMPREVDARESPEERDVADLREFVYIVPWRHFDMRPSKSSASSLAVLLPMTDDSAGAWTARLALWVWSFIGKIRWGLEDNVEVEISSFRKIFFGRLVCPKGISRFK